MVLKQDRTPLTFVNKLLLENTKQDKAALEFSIYKSGGEGVTLSRETFKLELNSSIISNIQERISSLKQGEELAIHSVIYFKSEKFYFPFVDLASQDESLVRNSIAPKIKDYLKDSVLIFSSGRSFHIYSEKKLHYTEWIKFLGSTLLLNPRKGFMENIDSRWVGHSLEQGFGSLRLSANTSLYLKVPELIETL